MGRSWLRRCTPGLGVAGALAIGVLATPLPLAWHGAAAWVLLALPGSLLALVLFGDHADPLALVVLGLIGGVSLPALFLLALHVFPGPLPWWHVLLVCIVLSAWLAVVLWRALPMSIRGDMRRQHSRSSSSATRRPVLILALVVMLGAGLRLAYLGASEFQGDEARAILLGLGVLGGRDDLLLVHKKGPVEVLLPAGPLALTGRINEFWARLPFALAGVGVLIGAYVLARALFDGEGTTGAWAGVVAAGFLAVDGLLLAFSRMVQYQSVLVLLSVGAVWSAWRFAQGAERHQRYLVCTAALAAVATLAHYDAVYVLPVLAWLVLAGATRRRWTARQWLRELAPALVVWIGLVASFYVPFVTHEQFARTAGYLAGRLVQESAPVTFFNNLPEYYTLATVYSTTFQVHWCGAILVAGISVWLLMYVRPRLLGLALAALLLLGCAVAIWAPWRFELPDGNNLAIVAFGLPLAALMLAPATPAALRTLVIWFGVPFVLQAFVLLRPGTHYYMMNVAAALLVGLAVARLGGWLHASASAQLAVLPGARKTSLAPNMRLVALRRLASIGPVLLGAGLAGLLALAAPYAYLVFVRQNPEYLHSFPDARPALYRAAYGDTLPRVGFFGFPHRSGWKAVAELYRIGALRGAHDGNEDYHVTEWYLHDATRCERDPDYYFVVPETPGRFDLRAVQGQYQPIGSVQVAGAPALTIYGRQHSLASRHIDPDPSIDAFDERPLLPSLTQPVQAVITSLNLAEVDWRSGIRLRDYGVDQQRLVAGRAALLWFNWQIASPPAPGYQLVLDVVNEAGQTVATASPVCSAVDPAQWSPDRRTKVTFTLGADPAFVTGRYTLRLALRHMRTGVSWPLDDGASALVVARLDVFER